MAVHRTLGLTIQQVLSGIRRYIVSNEGDRSREKSKPKTESEATAFMGVILQARLVSSPASWHILVCERLSDESNVSGPFKLFGLRKIMRR